MGRQILGFGLIGHTLTELEKEILTKYTPYAVVLFGRNVDNARQLVELVREVKALAPEKPPLIMIDEEGGRVDRLRTLLPGLPSAEAFSEGDQPRELSAWLGRIIGQALRYFDIEINLAPVVDVRREVPTKGLERRCFGRDAASVIELATEFMRGEASAGVASVIKHFPGMGDGNGDPHYGESFANASIEELREVDLLPYFAMANEARAVMVGHLTYPKIEQPPVPATLSSRISTHLLREVVGFNGVAITDDMEMHAVADLGDFRQNAERSLMAGNDVLLFCSQIERMPELVEHLERRTKEDEALSKRFDQAVERAEEYRQFCHDLRAKSEPLQSFRALEEEVIKFCEVFKSTRHSQNPGQLDDGDRRKWDRTPGTGKSGREEWT